MSPSETTGSQSVAFTQFLHRPRWPSTFSDSLGTSNIPHPPILVEESLFEAYLRFVFAYNLPTCSPPCRSRPGFHPAHGDFYIRASSGLVTRTAAGYDYSGNWASSTGGTHCLTPARPPTSIAVTENRTCRDLRRTATPYLDRSDAHPGATAFGYAEVREKYRPLILGARREASEQRD
jgi:hypothetical protein